MPVDSKGRPFDQAAADRIYTQLVEQFQLLGVRHTASFSNDPAAIMRDAANQLASYGVASLYDLTEKAWTEQQYQTDPGNPDGQPILVDVSFRQVFDSRTGREIPLNELNNSRGDGFTWYAIQFAGDVPILVSWKELTGAAAFAAQVGSIMNLPPVQALFLAFALVPMVAGGPTYMAAWTQSVGSTALGAVGINAAANPLLTKLVGSVAISTLRSGGNLSGAVKNLIVNEVAALVGSTVGTAVNSETVGRVAAAATEAEIGGKVPVKFLLDLGIDVATGFTDVQNVFTGSTIEPIKKEPGAVDNYLFDDDSMPDVSIYDPGELPIFDYNVAVSPEMQQLAVQLGSEQSALDAWQQYEFGITADGTIIATDKYTGTKLAETKDGKTYNVTGFIDSLVPSSLDQLNATLKSVGAVAITGTQVARIIEGKPITATRPPPGTVTRNADGSTTTYNYDGTVTRRLADGRVISSTAAIGQQAQMQNLTPLIAIGGLALLLAS
jgi:hypothetical protein